MPKYVIEREIPNAGKLSKDELQAISQKSCGVLRNLGPQIQWLQSYVTGDKLYCVYIAPNEKMVREHAEQGGFPANRISEVKSIIDPTTAERSTNATPGRELQTDRMPRFKTRRHTHAGVPVGCPTIVRGEIRRGVEAQPCDDGERVAVAGVNRDPFAAPALTKAAEIG
jgi:hypothetical protein